MYFYWSKMLEILWFCTAHNHIPSRKNCWWYRYSFLVHVILLKFLLYTRLTGPRTVDFCRLILKVMILQWCTLLTFVEWEVHQLLWWDLQNQTKWNQWCGFKVIPIPTNMNVYSSMLTKNTWHPIFTVKDILLFNLNWTFLYFSTGYEGIVLPS